MLLLVRVYVKNERAPITSAHSIARCPVCPAPRCPEDSTELRRTMSDRNASQGKAGERPRKAQKRERRRLQTHAGQCKRLKHALSDIERPDTISGETIEIQHGRLQAEATAADILGRAESVGSKITDADVLRVSACGPSRRTTYE